MKFNRFLSMLLVFFVACVLSGCGSGEEYVRDQAIQQTNQSRAREIYEKAQAVSAGQNLEEWERTAKDLQEARNLAPDDPAIASLAGVLEGKITDLKNQLKTLYAQADVDAQKGDWLAAVENLRQVNKISANYEETVSRLAKAEQEAAKTLYQQGKTLEKQDDWRLAAQTYKKLMDINPNYYDVAKLYQEAQKNDRVDYYLDEGEKAGRDQNWDRAIALLEKATEYQSDNTELHNKLESMKDKVGQLYLSEAAKLLGQGLLYKGLQKMEGSKNYAPSLPDDASYKDLANKFCAKLAERAENHIEKEQWGNAYAWLQKAETLNPNYQNLFKKKLEASDNIKARIKKSIAVFDFSSPGDSKDAGKIAANKLIVYLYKNASGDLRIVEREKLQRILQETQLSQTGLVDINTANVRKIKGIDTLIMGDVLQYATEYKNLPSTAQAKVLVNEDEVPNPDFSYWQMAHQRPTSEDFGSAPPRTIRKANYQFIPYTTGVAKITAMVDISYKLVDTSSGENIFTNSIPGKAVKEDKYQDAVPLANIANDPLDLPSAMEVLDELTNTKISEVGQSVLKHYQSLEVEYYNQARQEQDKRRNYDQAVERYTDAIFDEKLKGVATVISQKSQESIEKLLQNK